MKLFIISFQHFECVCVTLSFSFVSLAVPAPTDLRFGLVGSDSMEVSWASPRVPNPTDINSFLVR